MSPPSIGVLAFELVYGAVSSLILFAGQRATHHFLKNYYHAILCVILAQFSGRGFVDGMEGIIKLAQASPYVKVPACSAIGFLT